MEYIEPLYKQRNAEKTITYQQLYFKRINNTYYVNVRYKDEANESKVVTYFDDPSFNAAWKVLHNLHNITGVGVTVNKK